MIGDKRMGGFMWLRSMSQLKTKLYSVQIDPNEIAPIEAMGITNYKSLAEIKDPIDYAVSAVPRQVAGRILRDCVANHVGSIGFFTSGFSETGEELGQRLEADLREVALNSPIALVGPNCMGLYSSAVGLKNFPDEKVSDGGDVCFISQSGTHTINFCIQAEARGIRVNKAASIGNVLILEAAGTAVSPRPATSLPVSAPDSPGAAAAIIVSQTAWFKNWLRGYIVREASDYLNGTLSIERLGGNLLFGVEMENIGVSIDGSEVVAVKEGLVLDGFRLEERLATGAMSEVYLATQLSLQRKVAVKLVTGDADSAAEMVARFTRETQVLAAFSSPHVVQVLANNPSVAPVGRAQRRERRCIAMPPGWMSGPTPMGWPCPLISMRSRCGALGP